MNYTDLLSTVGDVHNAALRGTAKVVNQLHVLRNWTVGCLIFEFEQSGEDRAAYGEGLLKRLGADLASKGLMGLGLSNLKNCRTFYRLYPQIGQMASGQFGDLLTQLGKSQTPSGLLGPHFSKRDDASLATHPGGKEPPLLPAEILLRLSWSQFVEFIRFDDPWKRLFYQNECLKGGWTVSELQRQIGSLLYERTGLSTDKQAVLAHAHQQSAETPQSIAEIIRDPYVLEFTGLSEKSRYLEKDLEQALIDHLQSFLLELGTGFCFEARQRRVTIGNEHDYIDLVFYHRILRCHLLIDLKTRAFRHGDAGQIHPVRYHAKSVLLCLCAPKSQRRNALHGIHERSSTPRRRTSRRCRSLNPRSATARTCLLRGMSFASRRHQAREVSENSMGQTLHQRPYRRLSHGVNYYLNYWKDQVMQPGDEPPVGLILCTDKNQTRVSYATAGLDQELFVSRYLVALPKPEELQALIERDTAAWLQNQPSEA